MRRLAVSALLFALAACGGSSTPEPNTDGIPDACNPLGGQGCLLPWPSMVYAKTDATSATGFRLDLPIEGMPTNDSGVTIDPKPLLNRWDGFSPTGPILVAFPTGVSPANLPPFSDPAQSLDPASPILLLNEDTGERYPFFAEVDANVSNLAKQDLIIRPLARLPEKAHIIVAIRNTVKAADGSDLAVPDGFAALRDGTPFVHPRFDALADSYDKIFATLSTAGVDKADLVLAWDYVTASDAFLQNDLSVMRTAAVAAIGDNGANLTFEAEAQPPNGTSYQLYLGTFKSPNFLTDLEKDDSIIARDDTGNPKMSGMRDANFAAIIPNCVTTGNFSLPRPTVVFGHGLFGSAKEYLDDGFVQDLAEDLCVVVVAGDFIGLTSRQLTVATLAVNDMNLAPGISEKLGQSIVDFIALENAVRGPMAASPEFSFNGQPVIDTSKIYYIGGSLGGIMGNTLMAYDKNLQRGVLAVPGGVWSMLFERSNAWHLLIGSAMGSYPDLSVYQLNLAFLGMSMEPYDPITTAKHVLQDPLFDNPSKNILMWYTMGDCLVTNITTEFVLREMGMVVMAPSVKQPFGLTPMPPPMANGTMVFNDHPTPLPPDTNVPPEEDNGTHSGINRKQAAIREAQDFLLDGQIVPECKNGSAAVPCDCQADGSPCD